MSILTTIGVGSGIDTSALVSSLVSAQREARDTQLQTKSDRITAQISGISQLKSGLTNFSTALSTLIAGGTLTTQPTTSDSAVLSVGAISGQAVPKTSTQINVTQLAAAQSVASKTFASADAAIGTGTLTFNFGTATVADGAMTGFSVKTVPAPVSITIDSTNSSLSGVAAAINAKNAGITASVVTDNGGARLVVKGATGADYAFTMSADAGDGTSGLSQLNYGPASTTGSSLKQTAADAIVSVDGVSVKRSSNTISDLLTGVKLTLTGTGTATVGASDPSASISTAVTDFVGAYNEVQSIIAEQTDKNTGTLNGDASVRQMQAMLSKLTSTPLLANGHPATLAEIGVKTNRDGTLSVDTAALSKAMTSYPAQVEAMFNPSQASSSSLVRIVSTVGSVPGGNYAVSNLVAATSGTLTGGTVSSFSPLTLDGSNNSFQVSLDGASAVSVTVPAGTYADGASFAAALNDAIEASSNIAVHASVSWVNGALQASSKTTGSTSSITIAAADSGVAAATGLDATTTTRGANASGTIAGRPAIASGNLLFADSTTAAKGLTIQPLAGATSATIWVDQGLFNALNAITTALTSSTGALYSASTRLTQQQTQLATEQTKVDTDADALKTRLTSAFAAMDSKVAAYKSTQSFLTQQIDAWNSDN